MIAARKILISSVGLILVAFVVGLGLMLVMPRSQINHDNASKVHNGITLQDVEELLGPERNESTGPLWEHLGDGWKQQVTYESARRGSIQDLGTRRCWASDELVVIVIFDDQGLVRSTSLIEVFHEGWFDQVRRWLGL
jgi:hypothetical protein